MKIEVTEEQRGALVVAVSIANSTMWKEYDAISQMTLPHQVKAEMQKALAEAMDANSALFAVLSKEEDQ